MKRILLAMCHLGGCGTRLRFTIAMIVTFALSGAATEGAVASDIFVPADQPTIQDGIDMAFDGDRVIVAPGTYVENIDFLGKAITVTSEDGPDVTIIEGNVAGPVVRFVSEEGPASTINGFMIRNGRSGYSSPCFAQGGGICVNRSSPTITNNEIMDNTSCNGAGIAVSFGSPTIEDNIISHNFRSGCSGGSGGGGILIRGSSNANIIGNVITNNSTNSIGGGISLNGAKNVLVQDNLISENRGWTGGGIGIYGRVAGVRIIQNSITENTAFSGAGLDFENSPKEVANNTIANNIPSPKGYREQVRGRFFEPLVMTNNIIAAQDNGTAVVCEFFYEEAPPILEFNDVFSPLGSAYSPICVDPTGMDGNISEDPLFVDPSNNDYHLQFDSPTIDAGDNTAPNVPDLDLEGNPRIFDGDGDAVAVVDMGAFEFGSHPPVPDLINDLIDLVISQGFNAGVENPLLDKLNAALKLFEKDNLNAAISNLDDFINTVDAKKRITEEQAEELVAAAEEIISILETA